LLRAHRTQHRSGTLADDKLRTQKFKWRLQRFPVNHAQKHLDGPFSLARKIMVNSSQRRGIESGFGKVIVTDYRNVLGYSNPLCPQGPEGAQSHMIISSHNRREPTHAETEKLDYRRVAALRSPIAVKANGWFQPRLGERLCPTRSTFPGR